MTLPSSGPLSLGDIKGEFGGPASPSLGDYYAGGAYVPAGTTGTYGAVPSSGPISIRDFYGTSNTPPPLSASISPNPTYGSRTGAGSVTAGPATVAPSGGVAPYSYSWSRVSGDAFTINSPTAYATTFTAAVPAGVLRFGIYQCVVTDSLGATVAPNTTVELESF